MEVSFTAELQANTNPDVQWRIEGSAIVVDGEVLSRRVTAVTEFFIHFGRVTCFLVSLEMYSAGRKAEIAEELNRQLESRTDWRQVIDIQARGAAKNGTRTRP